MNKKSHNLSRLKKNIEDILTARFQFQKFEFTLLEHRFFSDIYELRCYKTKTFTKYILKVSTTSRSCENEFEQYKNLHSLGINSLVPVHYSKEFNYLITEKKELVPLDVILKNCKRDEERRDYFNRLGVAFKNLDSRTGSFTKFNEKEYSDYVNPRLWALKGLSMSGKNKVDNKIRSLISRVRDTDIRNCLVSDFSLGNLHIDERDRFVFVDMGDAYQGNSYSNIAYTFVCIKFGPLAQYLDFKGTSSFYFESFLKGYGIDKIDIDMFNLYLILHMINMISFISGLNFEPRSLPRRFISFFSNQYLLYRYKRFLKNL